VCVLDTLGHAAGVFVGAGVLHEKLHLRYLAAIFVFAGALLVSMHSDWGHGALREVRDLREKADEAALNACEVSDEENGEEDKSTGKSYARNEALPGTLSEPLLTKSSGDH